MHLLFTCIFLHWNMRRKALRRVRNYLLCQRTPASRGELSILFPCWSDAIKGRTEQSRALSTEEEREWAMRRDERGRAHCSTTQIQKKRTFRERLRARELKLHFVSSHVCSCIKEHSNGEGISCIMAISRLSQLLKLRPSDAFIPSTM